MEKFGWKEGRGLGKNEDGMSDHIKTKKREENSGVRHDWGYCAVIFEA